MFSLLPSLNNEKLVCATFADGGQCGSLSEFLIFCLFMLILGVVYLIVPFIIVSLVFLYFLKLMKGNR